MLRWGRVFWVVLIAVAVCAVTLVPAAPASVTKQRHHAKAKHKPKPRHKAKRKAKKPTVMAAVGTVELPVTFHVRNTNTSKVPCSADGAPYDVRGHLIGPAAKVASGAPRAVTLYVHGLGYGEFFWHFTDVPGYDYATQQADQAGQVSVVIDRLGYLSSGKPDGNQVCYGSEADYLHQIIGQLRHGTYDAGAGASPTFDKVALAGHSAGGFMVEAEAESYHDIDALIVAGFGNTGAGVPTFISFANTQMTCALNPLPHNYAYFGATPEDFEAQHFYDADPAVVAAAVAKHQPDPCMDTGSALQAIAIDVLQANTIKVPVLIVNGQNDALFPPPAGPVEKLWFSGNPDVKQVTLASTGHAMTLGRTAPKFRVTLGDWLKQHGF